MLLRGIVFVAPTESNIAYNPDTTPSVLAVITNGRRLDACDWRNIMLWTIFVILLVLWLLGWVGFHALGAYIHILLVLALVVLLIQLFTGRRPVV